MEKFELSPEVIYQLKHEPGRSIETTILRRHCQVRILIHDYTQQLKNHYSQELSSGLQALIEDSGIAYQVRHFGLEIHFKEPTELYLHNQDRLFVPEIKELISNFGLVVIKNAYLYEKIRDVGHRNRFPNLKFHFDRSPLQPTPYSLYSRNPFDDEQREPRESSTLFIPNLLAYIQSLREGKLQKNGVKGLNSNYDLFLEENVDSLIGKIIAEHRWDEPAGIGELSMIDNRTVLHASYHRKSGLAGYRIGVQYCG